MSQQIRIIGKIDLSKFDKPKFIVPDCHSCGSKMTYPKYSSPYTIRTKEGKRVEICVSCHEANEAEYFELMYERQMRYQEHLNATRNC